MGLAGIVLWFLAWIPLAWRQWQGWRAAHSRGDLVLARWHMASTFCVLTVLANAIINNTFHYAYIMGPTAIVIALAEHWRRRRQPGTVSPDG
jgi:hypothetical protein